MINRPVTAHLHMCLTQKTDRLKETCICMRHWWLWLELLRRRADVTWLQAGAIWAAILPVIRVTAGEPTSIMGSHCELKKHGRGWPQVAPVTLSEICPFRLGGRRSVLCV
jgi:hypothetical protein